MKATPVPFIPVSMFFAALPKVFAQIPPGISEFNEGENLIIQNFHAMSGAVLVLGAVFGLVGGLRVYNNWQLGKRNIDQEVIGWFSACLFLSILGGFLKVLYRIP